MFCILLHKLLPYKDTVNSTNKKTSMTYKNASAKAGAMVAVAFSVTTVAAVTDDLLKIMNDAQYCLVMKDDSKL